MLSELFKALYTIKKPGEIIDSGFRWRREKYDLYSIGEVKKMLNLDPGIRKIKDDIAKG